MGDESGNTEDALMEARVARPPSVKRQETTVKRVLVLLVLSAVFSSAQAQTRPSTVAMPCGASRQLVLARGAVVLGTGGHTYDRFVRDESFCAIGEYARQAFVPSLDAPSCFVGYRCIQGPRDWWDG